jgi:hypothetical protein
MAQLPIFIVVSIDKRRRQRAETSESRRRNVEVNTYRNNRNTETGGKVVLRFNQPQRLKKLSFDG